MGVPLVRVRDAVLSPHGGPVWVTISGLEAPQAVADALAAAGARAMVLHGRLTVVTTRSRLVDATGRALGATTAHTLDAAVHAAITAWHGPAADLDTPAGRLPCRARPVIMGVLNVTPDSFSNGGRYYQPASHPAIAIEGGRAVAAAGADLVDVGGESTRPGADPVADDEELRRVLPVVEALASDGLVVAIDTTKAGVARAAVQVGAAVVNDVSAGALDDRLLPAVAELNVPYVLMHMSGTPRTMQHDPSYTDVVAEVFDFLGEGLQRCAAAGIDPQRVVVDPGIGFGKTVAHNLMLLRHLREFTSLGRPVLVGASRKSFIGQLTGDAPVDERLEGSLAAAALAVANHAAILRVHDVAETIRAVRVAHAITTAA